MLQHTDTLNPVTPWCISDKIVLSQPEAEQYLEPREWPLLMTESWLGIKPWGALELTGERLVDVSLTREVDDCLQELLSEGVRLNRVEEIREYLLQFPDMIEATTEIVKVTTAYLPDAQITLEVYQDPEIVDSHLALYVRFDTYDHSIMEKIRDVRERCRKYLVEKEGWLHLTTDFQPAE